MEWACIKKAMNISDFLEILQAIHMASTPVEEYLPLRSTTSQSRESTFVFERELELQVERCEDTGLLALIKYTSHSNGKQGFQGEGKMQEMLPKEEASHGN